MVTVAISGPFPIAGSVAIDTFVTASLGGAAGDAIATYKDDGQGGGVYIICSKA